MQRQWKTLALAGLLSTAAATAGPAAPAATAPNLSCRDATGQHLWVKKLDIDVRARTVTLHVTDAPKQRVAVLVDSSERQAGHAIYAFNLPPLFKEEPVTNVFKLFHTGKEWRLIEAGLLDVRGTLALRALGQSVPYQCRDVP